MYVRSQNELGGFTISSRIPLTNSDDERLRILQELKALYSRRTISTFEPVTFPKGRSVEKPFMYMEERSRQESTPIELRPVHRLNPNQNNGEVNKLSFNPADTLKDRLKKPDSVIGKTYREGLPISDLIDQKELQKVGVINIDQPKLTSTILKTDTNVVSISANTASTPRPVITNFQFSNSTPTFKNN
jgi:hypothetical protein